MTEDENVPTPSERRRAAWVLSLIVVALLVLGGWAAWAEAMSPEQPVNPDPLGGMSHEGR